MGLSSGTHYVTLELEYSLKVCCLFDCCGCFYCCCFFVVVVVMRDVCMKGERNYYYKYCYNYDCYFCVFLNWLVTMCALRRESHVYSVRRSNYVFALSIAVSATPDCVHC